MSAGRIIFLLLAAAPALPGPYFENVTAQAGIVWRHDNGASANHFLPETTTGGVGFLDFDGDGWQDIFLVPGKPGSRCALYRNLHNGRFEDVSVKAGLRSLPFYGMGVAAGDFDNDGYTDLYVSGYPSGALFHNNGNGTFTEVTARAGVGNNGQWGSSAAWVDFDRDGLLDLFVANYVEFSYGDQKKCEFAGESAYCAQTEYRGSRSRLYRNLGDGKFQDVSDRSGVAASPGRALGAIAIDADGDGWPDLFIARDASPNLLLINQKDGSFRDRALELDVAYNQDGVARSGMGVDAADVNGDGLPDFAVTNFDHELHALYLSHAGQPYTDASGVSGLAPATQPYVGWGVRFGDFLNSGSAGLLIANGHLHAQIARSNAQLTYREPPLLLLNDGPVHFTNAARGAGATFRTGILGRGLATADFDNDGRLDAILTNLGSGPLLLHNMNNVKNHWMGVALRGTRSNRDATGARVTLQTASGKQVKWSSGGGSFLASNDRRLLFGLGPMAQASPLTVEIRWPNGTLQTAAVQVDRYNQIDEQ